MPDRVLPSRPSLPDLVVDTSAIVSILLREPSKDRLSALLADAQGPLISAGSMIETLMVSEGRIGSEAAAAATSIIDAAGIVVMPVDGKTVVGAHRAWQRFGKGNHPAGLNFGDCFTYALAAHLDLPVLCVGDDFARTDLAVIRP